MFLNYEKWNFWTEKKAGFLDWKYTSFHVSGHSAVGKEGGGIRATWIGHSTVLAEIDGLVVLTDPIFRYIWIYFNFIMLLTYIVSKLLLTP